MMVGAEVPAQLHSLSTNLRCITLAFGWIIFLSLFIPVYSLLKGQDRLRKKIELPQGSFPLWCRNLPFSMVMFSTFKQLVEFIYQKIIQKRKQDCSTAQQLAVTFLAGYTAGAVGIVIPNPADVVVSSLYNNKAKSVLQAVRNIGFVGFFTRSLPVRITIVGPVITLQWFFYDAIKVLSGFPTSGGVEKPVHATKLSV